MNQVPQLGSYDRRSVNRKLWRRHENGGLDVSLNDGMFSEINPGSPTINFGRSEFSENFAGSCKEVWKMELPEALIPVLIRHGLPLISRV